VWRGKMTGRCKECEHCGGGKIVYHSFSDERIKLTRYNNVCFVIPRQKTTRIDYKELKIKADGRYNF
jgi:hypothetical protein